MKKIYQKEVIAELEQIKPAVPQAITKEAIANLPDIVQRYLHFTGVFGKESVLNFRAECVGGIRNKSTDQFMKFKSVQYDFMNSRSRLFYITAKKMGLSAKGIHIYKQQSAIMRIKLLGLFTVVDAKGPEMDKGETVSLLNDICLLAPAHLISKDFTWRTIDELTVEVHFTNGNISISACLIFDRDGRLINFVSDDRYETSDGKNYYNYPWKTPISEYKNSNI